MNSKNKKKVILNTLSNASIEEERKKRNASVTHVLNIKDQPQQ